MNANDARITRVYVAQTRSVVEDPAQMPRVGPRRSPHFPGRGGNSIGSSGGEYRLTITAYDVTTGDNNGALTVGPLTENFNAV